MSKLLIDDQLILIRGKRLGVGLDFVYLHSNWKNGKATLKEDTVKYFE